MACAPDMFHVSDCLSYVQYLFQDLMSLISAMFLVFKLKTCWKLQPSKITFSMRWWISCHTCTSFTGASGRCPRLLCSALHTYPVLTLILDFEQFLAVYLWQCERGHRCVWESFGNYYKVGVNSHTLAGVSKVYSLLNAYRWRISRSCAL